MILARKEEKKKAPLAGPAAEEDLVDLVEEEEHEDAPEVDALLPHMAEDIQLPDAEEDSTSASAAPASSSAGGSSSSSAPSATRAYGNHASLRIADTRTLYYRLGRISKGRISSGGGSFNANMDSHFPVYGPAGDL